MLEQSLEQSLTHHPFSDFEETERDLQLLNELLTRLRTLVGAIATVGVSYPEQHIVECNEEGLYFRFVFNNWHSLLNLPKFVVVGFCGQRRAAISQTQIVEINALDASMVDEIKQHKGIVAYCTGMRMDGDYYNLILFGQLDDLSTLGNSAPHAKAAKHFSPTYYNSTRIHDGVLDGTIFSSALPQLRRTRYWDLTCQPIWTGERFYH